MDVTVLASLFNNKTWYNNGATFEATVDYTQCALNTSTMTVTVTDDTSDNGDGDGDGDGDDDGGSSGGGGALSALSLLVMSMFGLIAGLRRRRQ